MVNAAKKPTGTNSEAILYKKCHLVSRKFSLSGSALNMKTSSSGAHVIPIVFTVGRGSLMMSMFDALSSIGIFSRTRGELDNHYL